MCCYEVTDDMRKFLRDFGGRTAEFLQRFGSVILAFTMGVLLTVAVVLVLTVRDGTDKLEQLQKLIEDRFVEDVDETKLQDAAADAMVDALGDRWSRYLTVEEYKANEEAMNNAYVGVGITISPLEDATGFLIQKVAENGPAAQAGILPGDILVAADGVRAGEAGLDELKAAVKGEKGTTVSLTVLRDSTELAFEVMRDTVLVEVASAVMLEDRIGLVTISGFEKRCAAETLAAIQEMLDQGAEGLIFDVRFNPGGYTTELIEVLDYLLPEGPVFRTESYTGETHVDYSGANCLELPMAVLVNGSSYSAAEFFAAALQEYQAATIVGEKTCGKGYYQNTFQFSDGSGVVLSTGKYFTPEGRSLIGVGVTPDVEIAVDDETEAGIYVGTLDPMEDPQILAAINAIKSGN